MTVMTLTLDNFDEVLASAAKPLLVEFRADWCGPCHQMGPVLVRLAEEAGGDLDVGVIDFDDNLPIGRRYEVMSLPTLLLFIEGRPVRRLVGARGAAHLREELSQDLESWAQQGRTPSPFGGTSRSD